jgi:hypothetical protein
MHVPLSIQVCYVLQGDNVVFKLNSTAGLLSARVILKLSTVTRSIKDGSIFFLFFFCFLFFVFIYLLRMGVCTPRSTKEESYIFIVNST